MSPIQMRPDRITQEMVDYAKKLGEGMETLSNLGEIETGVTPKDPVYEEDKLVLYRYRSPDGKDPSHPVPVLMVTPLVNRPYMTDLQENRSMVRGLLGAGLDVYSIDWGYPDRADRFLNLDDYINGYTDRCVDVLRTRHQLDHVNVLGICQGGTISLCYAAIHPQKVRNLITMVTPVDFQTPDNMLSRWAQEIDVDLAVDTLGNIPGELLNWIFLTLKPFRLMSQKYVDTVDILREEKAAKNFMRMEKWIFDSPDQAGEAFREFVKQFFQKNWLIEGKVRIGRHQVDLKRITMPVLNIYAMQDHLVPPAASKVLRDYVSTKDYTELEFRGGHIGIYVSGNAQKQVPPAVGAWLEDRI
ncbi:MAG: class III poly(R)-hydroxyalkanoic acid synthase subunit PhaC [Gammaproteobacteria bacterium]|nr:class III poly(R)-hydroxyalkanoic acid synthase subunit PhaC [Gammaproteobacteria bacterium]